MNSVFKLSRKASGAAAAKSRFVALYGVDWHDWMQEVSRGGSGPFGLDLTIAFFFPAAYLSSWSTDPNAWRHILRH
jgi:hypothetical protein